MKGFPSSYTLFFSSCGMAIISYAAWTGEKILENNKKSDELDMTKTMEGKIISD